VEDHPNAINTPQCAGDADAVDAESCEYEFVSSEARMRYAISSLILIAAVTIDLPANAEVYRDPMRHFSFNLPPGWQAMPVETLNEFNRSISQRLSQSRPLYSQGFMPKAAEFTGCPYVLIHCVSAELNGLSYEQIERDFEREANTAVETVEGALSDIGSDLLMGKAVIDRSRNQVVFTTQMDLVDVGTVRGVTIGFLSSQGIVFLNCYDLSSDFERRAPLFKLMAESFTLDPGYEFKPGAAGLFGTGIPISNGLFFLAVGIGSMCAGLSRLVLRKVSNQSSSLAA
jgi:hypothetical protein